MKICFVNWAPYKDKRAGGVSVYHNNVVSFLNENHDVYTISCGVSYDFFIKKVFYKKKGNCFDIVNSSVVAPSHSSFASPCQMEDQKTEEAFCNALAEMKDLDVIHFNNFEGMPINTLRRIRKKFPNIKIIYSAHNYYTLCPQVNLWYLEKKNCIDFNDGKKCINCLPSQTRSTSVAKAYFLDSILKKYGLKNGTRLYSKIWGIATHGHSWLIKISSVRKQASISQTKKIINIEESNFSKTKEIFQKRREYFKECINETVDVVLGVSDRVSEILQEQGYRNVITSYIGTKFANNVKIKNQYLYDKNIRSIGYMGYMRHDKGFYFFINAMKKMDANIAKNINLVIAAKNTDNYMYWEIKNLTKKFNNVYYFDGYNEKNVNIIMELIDLGIIPSLWEDNLPQVAIEYHAKKIPILASDLGGACELNGKNEKFLYKHNSRKDLLEKITALVELGYDEKSYWDTALAPVTIKAHCEELLRIYNGIQ